MYINISKVDFGRCYSGGGEVVDLDYMTLSALGDGEITITIPAEVNSSYATSLSYSKDKSTWNETLIDGTAQTIKIPVTSGENVYLKGIAKQLGRFEGSKYATHINSSANIDASGNIMSLLYGDDFTDKTSFPEGSQYAFGYLFYGNNHLINAKNLILPATTLKIWCYYFMFYDCTALTTAPELPATTLADYCYSGMFNGCASLTTAPELPATRLASYCYSYMFARCTSLTTAPELPATTLIDECYKNMFSGCTSLTTAPELPATVLKASCYYRMFQGCTSLTTAPELPATTLSNDCYFRMFYGCTSLTTAPVLPATVLAPSCYYSMFDGCTSLTTAPVLPATVMAPECYKFIFGNCTSLTTAPELPSTTLADSCYSSMFNGCTSLTTAPALHATELADSCYSNMFNGCTSLTTASTLPATTLKTSCYASMFQGCTSLATAPELPATTLADYCYSNMFNGCASLNNITMLATNISATNCLNQWVMNVSSTGTFTKSPEMTSLPTGSSGIPSGWTVVDYTDYMTLTGRGDGEIIINIPAEINSSYVTSLSYSKDKSTWTDVIINDSVQTISITVTSWENVYLKGIAKQLGKYNSFININASTFFDASGNIMSLLYGDDYNGKTSFPEGSEYIFNSLFSGNTYLMSAEQLILPATTLASSCYSSMFNGCTSLTTAPVLPATTLSGDCYRYMFQGCTSLTNAPELPATTLTDYCYDSMFKGCTTLTTAPELPATTLTYGCYGFMFDGCTSLTTAPVLPATTLTFSCYGSMFAGCTSLNSITMLATDISASGCLLTWVQSVSSTGTFTKAAEMTSLPSGASGIPEGWEVKDYGDASVDYSQEYFTITALGDGRITLSGLDRVMPQYINNLSYSKDKDYWEDVPPGPEFQINVSSGDNVYFKGTGTQTAYNVNYSLKINSDFNINVSGNIMSLLYEDQFIDITEFPEGSEMTFVNLFSGNTNLISAENLILPATILTLRCYQNMFEGCTSLTTAPELPATTLTSRCYFNMFSGCTSLTAAPELPATRLESYCYSSMFKGCSSLTTAPALPATTLISSCYNIMFISCSSLNSITMLATDISASRCLNNWVSGVSSTGTFTKSPEMTSLPTGTSGIPEGWTVVDYGAA